MESEDKKPIFTKKLILGILAVVLLALIVFLLLRNCDGRSGNYSVQQININPTSFGLEVGGIHQLYASIIPNDAADQTVTWSSGNDLVATVDPNGLVTGISEGVTLITATANDGSKVVGSATVTVSNQLPSLEQIQIGKENYSVRVGKTVLVETTPIPSTAIINDITYEISDTSIATVNSSGVIKGVKEGKTSLIVSANNGIVTATATVTVTKRTTYNPPTPAKIQVSSINFGVTETCYKLKVGNKYALAPIVLPSEATETTLVWKSSNDLIATVKEGVITAVKQGTAIITATALSGVYSTFEVRVINSGTEAVCSAVQPCTNCGGSKTTSSPSTSVNVGETAYMTSENIEVKGTDKKNHKIKINAVLESDTLSTATNGYLRNAKCNISISGEAGLIYNAYYVLNSTKHEFAKYATILNVPTGGIEVHVDTYLTEQICDKNGECSLKQIVNDDNIAIVCDEVKINKKVYKFAIDDANPTCELSYDTSTVNEGLENATKTLKLTAKENGDAKSGLSKITWGGAGSEISAITDINKDEYVTEKDVLSTGIYTATVYDKAGKKGSCSIEIKSLDEVGTTVGVVPTTIKKITAGVNTTSIYAGDTSTIITTIHYDDGSQSKILDTDGNLSMYKVDVPNSDTKYTVSNGKIDLTSVSENDSITFKMMYTDNNGKDYTSNEIKIEMLASGKIICTSNPTNGLQKVAGSRYIYKGANVTCSTQPDDEETHLTELKIGYMTNGSCTYESTKKASDKNTTSIGATLETKLNGETNICWKYTTNKGSKEGSSPRYYFDNAAPTCTVVATRDHFEVYIHDEGIGFSKGSSKIAGTELKDFNNNFVKTLSVSEIDSLDNIELGDKLNNKATDACKVPTYNKAEMLAAQNEKQGGKVVISWGNSYESKNENGDVIANAEYTFRASYEIEVRSDSTTSMLKAIKNLENTPSVSEKTNLFNWSIIDGESNVIVMSDSNQSSEHTIRFIKEGSVTVQACHTYYTTVCSTQKASVSTIQIIPTKIHLYASQKLAYDSVGTYSAIFTPFNTTAKDIEIVATGPIEVDESSKTITVKSYHGETSATIYAVSKANKNIKSNIVTIELEADTEVPTIAIKNSDIVDNRVQYVYFRAADELTNVTMYYNLEKGNSCNPTKVSGGTSRYNQTANTIDSGGIYTACAYAVDALGHKSETTVLKIDSKLPANGAVNCTVSGTTSGKLVVGGEIVATVTCSSNENVTVHSTSVEGENVTATATGRAIYKYAVFNIVIEGKTAGKGKVTLPAGAVQTSTGRNSAVTIGAYDVYEPDQEIPAPSISFYCSTNPYNAASGCRYNVRPVISNIPDASGNSVIVNMCLTTDSDCAPRANNIVSISATGTYKICATFTVNGTTGPKGCTRSTYIVKGSVYKATFNSNNDSGSITSRECILASGATECYVESPNPGLREGYSFNGWSTDKKATSGIMGSTNFKLNSSATYYAIWKAVPTTSPLSFSVKCGSSNYTNGAECKESIEVNVSGAPSGATLQKCIGSLPCVPSSNNYTPIKKSGTYVVCANYVLDQTTSSRYCTGEINTKIIGPTKPTISITASDPGYNTWTNSRGLITIAVSDDKANTKVELECVGISCGANATASSTTFQRGLIITDNGNYTIRVVATDSDGNKTSLLKRFDFNKIDKTAPSCTMSYSGNTLTVTVKDTGSGITAYDMSGYNWADKFIGIEDGVILNETYRTTIYDIGTYVFTLKDDAGNQGSCSIKLIYKYGLSSCKEFAYGTPTTTTVGTCTPSGTAGSSLSYTTCDAKTLYGCTSCNGGCIKDGDSLPITRTATVSTSFSNQEAAKAECTSLIKAACSSIGLNYAGSTCSIKFPTYTKEVRTANRCLTWGTTYWSINKPLTTGCNTITCKTSTKVVAE